MDIGTIFWLKEAISKARTYPTAQFFDWWMTLLGRSRDDQARLYDVVLIVWPEFPSEATSSPAEEVRTFQDKLAGYPMAECEGE